MAQSSVGTTETRPVEPKEIQQVSPMVIQRVGRKEESWEVQKVPPMGLQWVDLKETPPAEPTVKQPVALMAE